MELSRIQQGNIFEDIAFFALGEAFKPYGIKVECRFGNRNKTDLVLRDATTMEKIMRIEVKNCNRHYKVSTAWLKRCLYDKIAKENLSKTTVIGSIKLFDNAKYDLRDKGVTLFDYGKPLTSYMQATSKKFRNWIRWISTQILNQLGILPIRRISFNPIRHVADGFLALLHRCSTSIIHGFLAFPRMIFAAIPRFLRISVTTPSTR